MSDPLLVDLPEKGSPKANTFGLFFRMYGNCPTPATKDLFDFCGKARYLD